MGKSQYRRLNLKNGWDLPKGEKIPLTGRRQELVRAYELLVQKTDEDYLEEAKARKQQKEVRETKQQQAVISEEIRKNLPYMPEAERMKYMAALENNKPIPVMSPSMTEDSARQTENSGNLLMKSGRKRENDGCR